MSLEQEMTMKFVQVIIFLVWFALLIWVALELEKMQILIGL
jgi:hypothetical protein